jgi:hypothetical protein
VKNIFTAMATLAQRNGNWELGWSLVRSRVFGFHVTVVVSFLHLFLLAKSISFFVTSVLHLFTRSQLLRSGVLVTWRECTRSRPRAGKPNADAAPDLL